MWRSDWPLHGGGGEGDGKYHADASTNSYRGDLWQYMETLAAMARDKGTMACDPDFEA